MRLMLLGFLTVFFIPPTGSLAASFDCQQAITKLEKTICDNEEISKLDEDLAKKYEAALNELSDEGQEILRDNEKRWLNWTYDVCFKYKNDREPKQCVSEKFRSRLKTLENVALRVGPYLFSSVDYFYLKDDADFGRPYEGQTSFPHIDAPSSNAEKQWNKAFQKTKADGDDWCDGKPGDIDNSFKISFATPLIISVEKSNWMYCHGAAHGYGGPQGATYILRPEFHALKTNDLFNDKSDWKKFIVQKCYDYLEEKNIYKSPLAIKGYLKEYLLKVDSWVLTNDGLKINMGSVFGYAGGEQSVIIPWQELRPFLIANAPAPH